MYTLQKKKSVTGLNLKTDILPTQTVEKFFSGCTFTEDGTVQDPSRGVSAPFPCISFCRELTAAFWRQRYIKGGVDIGMVNVSAVWTLKLLTMSVAYMSAAAAFFC